MRQSPAGKRCGHPIARDAYDELAEAYADAIDSKPENAYYERPATLSLLPCVRGKRVLDAGCGPGQYAEWLAAHGATVTAVDASQAMVRLAKKRLGGRAQVAVADIGRPLSRLKDASFDIVLCALVLDHIGCWGPTFREFHRVLTAEGLLVFSIGHPFMEFLRRSSTGIYFDTELAETPWRSLGKVVTVPSYRRPLGAVWAALKEAGFTLKDLVEARPTQEFRALSPEAYDRLMKQPGFLCISATRRGRSGSGCATSRPRSTARS